MGGHVTGVKINAAEELPCEQLVLAPGHSARDTFSMLYENQFPMSAKPFAVGFRVEHPQALINRSQYGAEQVKGLGAAAYKVDYVFEALEGGNAAVKFATAPAAAFTSANMISLKVYGDLSGNQLKAVFANGAEKKTVSLGALDYLGWKDVKASLEGIGEGSYTLQGFVVEQVGNAYGKKGIIYLDKVAQGAAADGVAKVEIAGLRIYPNPASELLIANADGTILGVEVLTLDGRTVARTTTNVVNVSDLAEGAYIAKVYTLSGCESRQIVVKH